MSGMNVSVAIKKAATWRTPVECGAGDGHEFDEVGGWLDIAQREDKRLGLAMAKEVKQGYETMTRTLRGALRYGAPPLLPALLWGTAGTPTDLTGAYQHDLVMADDVDGLFATLAVKDGQRIQEVPSVKVAKAEISSDSGQNDGVVQAAFDLVGDTKNLNGVAGTNNTTTFAAVTITDEGNRAMHEEGVFRINDQAGDALDGDDEIELQAVRIAAERPMTGSYTNTARSIGEPRQTALMGHMVTLVYPYWDSTILALVDDWLAGTAKKGDFTWTGELITGALYYQVQAQYPKLQPVSMEALRLMRDERITPITIGLKGLLVDSAPSGMSGITRPQLTLINTHSTDPLA